MCGKIAYMYKGFICEPELVEKYKWKALPINNKEGLLWFCIDHKMGKMLEFRRITEKYGHRFRWF